MPIEINSPTNGVNPPDVTLNGRLVSSTNGQAHKNYADEVITSQKIDTVGTNGDVIHRASLTYYEDVTVTLSPDSKYSANSYPKREGTGIQFVGPDVSRGSSTGIIRMNSNSDTYYSLNGKDPRRTKNNLYTGPFTLSNNTSGTDNIVLKARTYYQGKKSEVRTVELKIVKSNASVI